MREHASAAQALGDAIQNRSGRVLVLGLGAVGLPLVRVLLEGGFSVVAADTDADKVRSLAAGRSPYTHLSDAWLGEFVQHERLAWHSLEEGKALPASAQGAPIHVGILCVPTPLHPDGEPDLTPLRRAAQSVAASLDSPGLVILESTTFPGTTRRIVAPILQQAGWQVAQEGAGESSADQENGGAPSSPPRHAFLAFAPERVDPGRGDPAGLHSPRLVGGLEEVGSACAQALYEALGYRVHVTPRAEVAEAAKLVENVYRAVNIALVNELKVSFAAQGIDIWEVLDAAQTKSFGFQRFDPGPGAGGSCIPVDPRYLEHFAREGGTPVRLVELAGRIDRQMVEHVESRLLQALAQTTNASLDAQGELQAAPSPLVDARVLLVGVAYKPGVSMTTESPALRLAARLIAGGAQVAYWDPHVSGTLSLPGAGALPAAEEPIDWSRWDAAVYLTDHPEFDLELIARCAPLLIDTRGKAELRAAGHRYWRA